MSATVGLWEHFRKLLDFRGREDRASFWPYAAVAFIVIMIAGMAIFMPMMARSMAEMQQYAIDHPDQVSVVSGPGQYSVSVHGSHPEFFPAASMLAYLAVTFGLSILLYAAAVTRRLHDRGMSGWWGLMPLPFVAYSSVMMPMMFGSVGSGGQPNIILFFSIFFSNMAYIVALIVLIVFLAGASSPISNRFDCL